MLAWSTCGEGVINPGAVDEGVKNAGAFDEGVINAGALDEGVINAGTFEGGFINADAVDGVGVDKMDNVEACAAEKQSWILKILVFGFQKLLEIVILLFSFFKKLKLSNLPCSND